MTLQFPIIALVSLSLTGCVAAVPLATQLLASPDARAHLCSFAKLPGETVSLCDRIPFASATQTPVSVAPVPPKTTPR